MKKAENPKTKDVFVTIVVTESTCSELSLHAPHLDQTDTENSRICVITEKDYLALKKLKKDQDRQQAAGTSIGLGDNSVKLTSEVALFSTSNVSSTSEFIADCELQGDTLSDSLLSGSSTELFKKTDIVHHPLVSVRSVAHANKLLVERNNLYVSLLDSDSHISSEFMCRICHGGESFDDLLTPCRCRGTIALVHLKCLERWLKESNHSSCELCQHHFRIVREPRYSIPWSILVFLRHPGLHLKEIVLDLMAFSIYTPSAVASTYMLMLICEALVKNSIVTTGSMSSHIIAFSAVFGMAAIDFTYSSWLIVTMQKHVDAWREWYNANSKIRVVLPKIKMRPHKRRQQK